MKGKEPVVALYNEAYALREGERAVVESNCFCSREEVPLENVRVSVYIELSWFFSAERDNKMPRLESAKFLPPESEGQREVLPPYLKIILRKVGKKFPRSSQWIEKDHPESVPEEIRKEIEKRILRESPFSQMVLESFFVFVKFPVIFAEPCDY